MALVSYSVNLSIIIPFIGWQAARSGLPIKTRFYPTTCVYLVKRNRSGLVSLLWLRKALPVGDCYSYQRQGASGMKEQPTSSAVVLEQLFLAHKNKRQGLQRATSCREARQHKTEAGTGWDFLCQTSVFPHSLYVWCVGWLVGWSVVRHIDLVQTVESPKGLSGKFCPREEQPWRKVWLSEGPPVGKFSKQTLRIFHCFSDFWIEILKIMRPRVSLGLTLNIFRLNSSEVWQC